MFRRIGQPLNLIVAFDLTGRGTAIVARKSVRYFACSMFEVRSTLSPRNLSKSASPRCKQGGLAADLIPAPGCRDCPKLSPRRKSQRARHALVEDEELGQSPSGEMSPPLQPSRNAALARDRAPGSFPMHVVERGSHVADRGQQHVVFHVGDGAVLSAVRGKVPRRAKSNPSFSQQSWPWSAPRTSADCCRTKPQHLRAVALGDRVRAGPSLSDIQASFTAFPPHGWAPVAHDAAALLRRGL